MIIHMHSKHLFLIISQNLQKVNRVFTVFSSNDEERNVVICEYGLNSGTFDSYNLREN